MLRKRPEEERSGMTGRVMRALLHAVLTAQGGAPGAACGPDGRRQPPAAPPAAPTAVNNSINDSTQAELRPGLKSVCFEEEEVRGSASLQA